LFKGPHIEYGFSQAPGSHNNFGLRKRGGPHGIHGLHSNTGSSGRAMVTASACKPAAAHLNDAVDFRSGSARKR